VSKSGCFSTQSSSARVTWSVSDTTHATISNAQDQALTFGVATCAGSAPGPITVTATLPADLNNGASVSGSAQLSCKMTRQSLSGPYSVSTTHCL
jgi:hypothetical protein